MAIFEAEYKSNMTLEEAKALVHDGRGDEHYDLASAFIKSMRGSDPDATVYWLARMLEAGEDPDSSSEDSSSADSSRVEPSAEEDETTP